LGDKVKDGMCGALSMHGTDETFVQNFGQNTLKEETTLKT